MKRLASILCLFPLASGCATSTPQPAPAAPESRQVAERPAAAPVDVGIDWGWRIVGDAAIRPVQVFSLNGRTYMQMPARDRQLPVVIMVDGEVVPHMTGHPYLIIHGEPPRIDIVSDGFRVVVERTATRQADVQTSPVMPATGRVLRGGIK